MQRLRSALTVSVPSSSLHICDYIYIYIYFLYNFPSKESRSQLCNRVLHCLWHHGQMRLFHVHRWRRCQLPSEVGVASRAHQCRRCHHIGLSPNEPRLQRRQQATVTVTAPPLTARARTSSTAAIATNPAAAACAWVSKHFAVVPRSVAVRLGWISACKPTRYPWTVVTRVSLLPLNNPVYTSNYRNLSMPPCWLQEPIHMASFIINIYSFFLLLLLRFS